MIIFALKLRYFAFEIVVILRIWIEKHFKSLCYIIVNMDMHETVFIFISYHPIWQKVKPWFISRISVFNLFFGRLFRVGDHYDFVIGISKVLVGQKVIRNQLWTSRLTTQYDTFVLGRLRSMLCYTFTFV